MLKLCRKYLSWVQNSVFEGEITDVKLKELIQNAHGFMDKTEDSIILFKHASVMNMDKEIIGKERGSVGFGCSFDKLQKTSMYIALKIKLLQKCRYPHVFYY